MFSSPIDVRRRDGFVVEQWSCNREVPYFDKALILITKAWLLTYKHIGIQSCHVATAQENTKSGLCSQVPLGHVSMWQPFSRETKNVVLVDRWYTTIRYDMSMLPNSSWVKTNIKQTIIIVLYLSCHSVDLLTHCEVVLSGLPDTLSYLSSRGLFWPRAMSMVEWSPQIPAQCEQMVMQRFDKMTHSVQVWGQGCIWKGLNPWLSCKRCVVTE